VFLAGSSASRLMSPLNFFFFISWFCRSAKFVGAKQACRAEHPWRHFSNCEFNMP